MTVRCPGCGGDNRSQSKYCSTCGHQLRPQTAGRCPQCGAQNPPNNIFCDELRRRPKPGQFIYLDEPVTTDAGSELGPREIADERAQPDEDMLKGELSVVVMNAYKKIPADFRKAAMLRDIEGLSYEEIAVITNAELGTVKSRISRARAKMQRSISPYLRESA